MEMRIAVFAEVLYPDGITKDHQYSCSMIFGITLIHPNRVLGHGVQRFLKKLFHLLVLIPFDALQRFFRHFSRALFDFVRASI